MHKREKIEEAKYFYSKMIKNYELINYFRYNLSAFLSASRSVLQYAERESDPGENPNAKPGAKFWFDKYMENTPLFKFLKDERDDNIHVEPINLRKDIEIMIAESVGLGEMASAKIKRADGRIELRENLIDTQPKSKKVKASVESESTIKFNDWMEYCQSEKLEDWTGDEDVITLCEKYTQELEKVVEDGVSKGFITG